MFTQAALIVENDRLQKFAMRLTKNKSDADDLVQSTCLRALEKADLFQTGTNLFSWTSRIMFNIFISSYRRRNKFETQYDPQSYLDKIVIQPTQDINLELAHARKAITQLNQKHRDILVSICIEGVSYEEFSMMTGIPIGTVRSRLSRAREQLHIIMDTPTVRDQQYALRAKQSRLDNKQKIPAYIAAQALSKSA